MSVETLFVRLMTALFIVGVAGCLFVIPITAYRLFAVLFERDDPNEAQSAIAE